MGMSNNITRLLEGLDEDEIEILLSLYYNKDRTIDSSENIYSTDILKSLIQKNLISSTVQDEKNTVSLTRQGLSLCSSVMFERVKTNVNDFKADIKDIPQRLVAFFINRLIFNDEKNLEGQIDENLSDPYFFDEPVFYEKLILKNTQIHKVFSDFNKSLARFGLAKDIDGEIWFSPDVEKFLKNQYKDIMSLSWSEEDSLKYFYFFFYYAQGQRNLINFADEGLEYKSMFFENEGFLKDICFSNNNTNPVDLIQKLGLSEQRIIGFLSDMQNKGIVQKRNYPTYDNSFFNDEDKIFVIKDIK